MDNARIHYYDNMADRISQTNNRVVYNIPYRPQYNPVELTNNITKNIMKDKLNGNLDNIDDKLKNITAKIKKDTYNNCFDYAYKCIINDHVKFKRK